MNEYIISGISGGAIAIISLVVSYYFKSKNDKQKYVFEKLENIIESISKLKHDFILDINGIIGQQNQRDRYLNNIIEENKLECLIKILP